ncbi:MAG: hypothetical protein WCC10_07105 [Tumebacillaceae bacterium]
MSDWKSVFDELAKEYRVPDLVPEPCTFLFLLESPHVQELKHGAPVSGSSGISMTKHLFGDRFGKEPLGIVVKNQRVDKVGLMNVCQIPMQAVAYGDEELKAKYAEFLAILERVRSTNNKMSYADSNWNDVQEILVENLRHRLGLLTERNLHVVPCGKFAQKFFRLADVQSPKWRVLEGVPHPSYNGWSKSEYAAAVNSLLEAFAE